MKSALTTLALLMLATPACASDRLAPAQATAYQPAVLKGVFASDVDVFAIVKPPFAPEYAVGMRLKNGDYRIFALSADEQDWPRLLRERSADASQYCETVIAPALGARIAAVWDAMLRSAGPDSDLTMTSDIALYDFAKIVDGKAAVGVALDRDADSRVGMLQAIAVDMQTLCQSPGAFEHERFASRVDALAAALQLLPVEKKP
jgi:hypothetical protein